MLIPFSNPEPATATPESVLNAQAARRIELADAARRIGFPPPVYIRCFHDGCRFEASGFAANEMAAESKAWSELAQHIDICHRQGSAA